MAEVTMSVRLPARLHEQVVDQATKEERSVAAIIRIALRTYLLDTKGEK
jgi:predicted HicB family RNase H-like nuclease